MSRDQDVFAHAAELDEMEREETSPTWPGVSDELYVLRHEPDNHADNQSTWHVSEDIAGSRTASPSRDNTVKSPSPPPRGNSVASREASASTRAPSVQSSREKVARSRGSTAASSTASGQWQEALRAAENADERKSSSSSRSRIVSSRESNRQEEETRVEEDTRTSSAKSAQGGAETKATLGSEADLAQVSETIVRSQSVAEGVYEDVLAEEETADQEWPGMMEGEEVYEPDEMSKSGDEDSITQGNASSHLVLRLIYNPLPPGRGKFIAAENISPTIYASKTLRKPLSKFRNSPISLGFLFFPPRFSSSLVCYFLEFRRKKNSQPKIPSLGL